MSIIRPVLFLTVVASALSLFGQQQSKQPRRDPLLLNVLAHVVSAAGGAQALTAVHDITESGEITFHWGDGVSGPVTIQGLGGSHFRMEAELPEGKRAWVVNDGDGTKREGGQKALLLSSDNAINLGNLTFPTAQIAAVLADLHTDISLVGVETRDGRSIYRLRLKGRLGLSSKPIPELPVKDFLVDALTFTILSVEDQPFQTYEAGGRLSDKPSRQIEFWDYRSVDGVLMPFSISTKLMGQRTLTIHLTSIAFNSNLSPEGFKD